MKHELVSYIHISENPEELISIPFVLTDVVPQACGGSTPITFGLIVGLQMIRGCRFVSDTDYVIEGFPEIAYKRTLVVG